MKVLVVDDSAVVRQIVTAILAEQRDITVQVASDPLIAMQKMQQSRPDVILLDLEMPRMDGLTFLRKLMSEDPIPVVVCSALAGRGSDVAVQALEEGAVDIVTKPRLGVREFLIETSITLTDTLRAAASAKLRSRLRHLPRKPKETADAVLAAQPPAVRYTTDKVVAMGASTGGTEALSAIIEALPPDAPAVVVVQHMPEVFTASFARRLNDISRVEVKEAADGDRAAPGHVLIAPGNRHLIVRRSGARYVVELADGPLVSRHRPSVDVLFRSVAQAAGPNAIGVILTGMGSDGAAGLLEMFEAGAVTIAQNEATCVVFGMPKEAIARGAVHHVLPLGSIPGALVRMATAQ
ncbi:MAG TPA: chemotaxis response regulator protein-glutamate methylesterase [Thermoanaerobaculia bacterium]|nr:chemotaxis response regulator protein-glutamate methylesterase [Thermoanaerobaculia bacterium]